MSLGRQFVLNNFRTLQKSCSSVRRYCASRNVRGGHGHDHHAHEHHAPLGPYEVPHHATYPTQAFLFGIDPSKPYQSEGWELLTIVTYVLTFGIIFGTAAVKDLDSFKTWARQEALAREVVVANGGEIEFGQYYNQIKYEDNGVDAAPKLAEE